MESLIKTLYSEFRDFRRENNEKLDLVSTQVNKIEKNQALMAKDIEMVKREDELQNQIIGKQQKILDEHVQGTIQVREQNNMRYKEIIARLEDEKLLRDDQIKVLRTEKELLKKEVDILKRPQMWIKMTLWILTSVGVVTGAIWGVIRLFEEFTNQGLF